MGNKKICINSEKFRKKLLVFFKCDPKTVENTLERNFVTDKKPPKMVTKCSRSTNIVIRKQLKENPNDKYGRV